MFTAAAILNGLKEVPINEKSRILYLGASTGTTVSHCSDIAKQGIIYALEFSERVFRSLIELSKRRKNIVPILADARKPEDYYWIEEVDVVYCDIAQPDESLIAIRNTDEFLKPGGYVLIAIKSQSIDVTKDPKKIYEEEKGKLKKSGFSVLQLLDLEPYEEKHAMILAKK
jgi:fibrillarin-like pre-rRNA processing protein